MRRGGDFYTLLELALTFHRFYRYKFVGEIHLDKSRLISISSLCNTSKTDFSTAADADNLKLHHIQFQIVSTKRKICVLTITAQMLPLVFSSHRCQPAFLQFGYQPAKKTWGVQRGISPWIWVSNRGREAPCWHTILLAKSSVLYLLRPLTLERGCQLGSPQNRRFCGERRSSGVNESCRLRRDE